VLTAWDLVWLYSDNPSVYTVCLLDQVWARDDERMAQSQQGRGRHVIATPSASDMQGITLDGYFLDAAEVVLLASELEVLQERLLHPSMSHQVPAWGGVAVTSLGFSGLVA
jgi:hypothetical protein